MIDLEHRKGIAVLAIENGRANALDVDLLGSLRDALTGLDDQTSAVVLTGKGRMFSAGLDLGKLIGGDAAYTLALVEVLEQLLEAMVDLQKPAVAAINGHAIAGGYILASACDVRILAEGDARLGLTEMLLGVPFPPLALELVRAAVGDSQTRQIVLGAQLYAPAEALSRGLVDELRPPEQLVERAVELAERLARIPRRTFALTKRQLLVPLRHNLAHFGGGAAGEGRRLWIEPDTVERIRRFAAERLG